MFMFKFPNANFSREVPLFHITNLFCPEMGKFDFFMRKKANLKQIGNYLYNPLVTAG